MERFERIYEEHRDAERPGLPVVGAAGADVPAGQLQGIAADGVATVQFVDANGAILAKQKLPGR